MRISSIAVLVGILISFSTPAFAFYRSGRVNSDISYSNIELIKKTYSVRVTGALTNKTSQTIKLDGKILFMSIHKEILNSTTLYETLPPHGTVHFDRILDKNNYKKIQNAYKIEWQVEAHKKGRSSSGRSRSKKSTTGYSITRSYDSYINVSGKGNHHSDQFKMKTGRYIAKASHDGEDYCGIKLLRSDGIFTELIANEYGSVDKSKMFRIDEAGYYLLDVSADGDWTVRLEYQEPKTLPEGETAEPSAPAPAGENSGASNPVVIKLKNGRTLRADSYWEEGDHLKVSIYGGIMSVSKKDVEEIIKVVQVR